VEIQDNVKIARVENIVGLVTTTENGFKSKYTLEFDVSKTAKQHCDSIKAAILQCREFADNTQGQRPKKRTHEGEDNYQIDMKKSKRTIIASSK
jgi:hypothetical protein